MVMVGDIVHAWTEAPSGGEWGPFAAVVTHVGNGFVALAVLLPGRGSMDARLASVRPTEAIPPGEDCRWKPMLRPL